MEVLLFVDEPHGLYSRSRIVQSCMVDFGKVLAKLCNIYQEGTAFVTGMRGFLYY